MQEEETKPELVAYNTTNDVIHLNEPKPRFSEILPNREHITESFTQYGGAICDASTDFEKSHDKHYATNTNNESRFNRGKLMNSIFSSTGMQKLFAQKENTSQKQLS